jgi:hypothetical protein
LEKQSMPVAARVPEERRWLQQTRATQNPDKDRNDVFGLGKPVINILLVHP